MAIEANHPKERRAAYATAQSLTLTERARLTGVELPSSVTFLSLSSLNLDSSAQDISGVGEAFARLLDWEIMAAQTHIVGSTMQGLSERAHLSMERQHQLEEGVVILEVGETIPAVLAQKLASFQQVIGNDVLRLTSNFNEDALFAARVQQRPNKAAFIIPIPQFLSLSILERDPQFSLLQSNRYLAPFIDAALQAIPHTENYDRAQQNLEGALRHIIENALVDTSGQINWGTRQSDSATNQTQAKIGTTYETVRIVTSNELGTVHPRQRAQHRDRFGRDSYYILRELGGRKTITPLDISSIPENTPRQQLAKAAISMLFSLSDWRRPAIHDLFFYVGKRGYQEVLEILEHPLLVENVARPQEPWDREAVQVRPARYRPRRRIAQNLVLAALVFTTLGVGSAAAVATVKDASFGIGSQGASSQADHLEGLPSFSQVDWEVVSHGLPGDGYYITDTVAQMNGNQYTLVTRVDHTWQPVQITADTPYQTLNAPILLSGIQSSKIKIPLLVGTTAASISLTTTDGKQIPVTAVVLSDGTIAVEIPGGFALHPTAAMLSYTIIASNEGPHAIINPNTFAVNLADFQRLDPQMYQKILGLQQQVLAGQDPDVVVTNYLEQNFTTYSINDPSLQGLSKEQILSQLLRMQTNGFHCSYSNLLKIMLIASITPASNALPNMTIAQGWKLNIGSIDSSHGNFLTAANGHAFVLTEGYPDDYTPANIRSSDVQTQAYVNQQANPATEQQILQQESLQLQQQAQNLSLIIHALEILIPTTLGAAASEGVRRRNKKRKYTYRPKRKAKNLQQVARFVGTSAREISSLPKKTREQMVRKLEASLFQHFTPEELLFAVNFFNSSTWAPSRDSHLGTLTHNDGFEPITTGQQAVTRIMRGSNYPVLREVVRLNDFNRFYKQFYTNKNRLLVLINKQRQEQQLPPLSEAQFKPSRAYAFKYWALAKYAFLYGMQQARQEARSKRRNNK